MEVAKVQMIQRRIATRKSWSSQMEKQRCAELLLESRVGPTMPAGTNINKEEAAKHQSKWPKEEGWEESKDENKWTSGNEWASRDLLVQLVPYTDPATKSPNNALARRRFRVVLQDTPNVRS